MVALRCDGCSCCAGVGNDVGLHLATVADVPERSVPHMGWNRIWAIEDDKRHPLLINVEEGAHVYFVHSYYAKLSADTIARCDYGETFTAIVSNGNFMGCQFHPERSGSVGEQILRNFLAL